MRIGLWGALALAWIGGLTGTRVAFAQTPTCVAWVEGGTYSQGEVVTYNGAALDYCAPQYYDGPNLADPAWIAANVDVWMGLIPQKNFVFGFGIDPNLNNYETIQVGSSVWQSISARYPAIGGAFDWQINEDLLNGAPFANQLAPLINPSGAPAAVP